MFVKQSLQKFAVFIMLCMLYSEQKLLFIKVKYPGRYTEKVITQKKNLVSRVSIHYKWLESG